MTEISKGHADFEKRHEARGQGLDGAVSCFSPLARDAALHRCGAFLPRGSGMGEAQCASGRISKNLEAIRIGHDIQSAVGKEQGARWVGRKAENVLE